MNKITMRSFVERIDKIAKESYSTFDEVMDAEVTHLPVAITISPITGDKVLQFNENYFRERAWSKEKETFGKSYVTTEELEKYKKKIEFLEKELEQVKFANNALSGVITSNEESISSLGKRHFESAYRTKHLERLAEEQHKSINYLWASVVASVVFSACCFVSLLKPANATDMIIGDSHVGGLKPYLQKHMGVRYKNGTTSAYWLKQPAQKVNTLFVMTGTNEQFIGTSPSKWLNQTYAVCRKWNPNRCVIVAPPPNGKKNWQSYRSVLKPNSNIVSSYSVSWKVDKVHFTPNGYKQIARQILEKR